MNLLALTNPITAAFVADAVLAVTGKTPIMSHSLGELPAWRSRVSAAYINLGAFDPARRAGADWLSRQDFPFVLDPVGVVVNSSRRSFAQILLARTPALVKGNASEIAALFGLEASPRAGIDAQDDAETVAAQIPLSTLPCPILISGQSDLLLSAEGVTRIPGGDAAMARLVGLGCALGAVSAALLPHHTALDAARVAAGYFKQAGAEAAKVSRAPGRFRRAFLDALAAQAAA